LRVARRQETKLGAKLEAKAARDDQQRRRAATKAKQQKERAAAKSTKRTVRPLGVDGSATLASADAAADDLAGGGPRSGGHRRARAAAALASAEAALAADQLAAEGATGSGRGTGRRQGYWQHDEAWGKGSPGGFLSRWGWGQPLAAAARPSSVGGAANGGGSASAATAAALANDPLALLKQHGATMRVEGNDNKKALAFTTYRTALLPSSL